MLGQQNEVYRTRFSEDNSSVSEVRQLNCFWTTIRWHDVDILCSLGLPAHTTHRNTKMRSNMTCLTQAHHHCGKGEKSSSQSSSSGVWTYLRNRRKRPMSIIQTALWRHGGTCMFWLQIAYEHQHHSLVKVNGSRVTLGFQQAKWRNCIQLIQLKVSQRS